MVGINTTYDDHATMANARYVPKKLKKNEMRDPLQPNYRKDATLHHTLQSVVSGSITTLDRLCAAEMIPTDTCECLACLGARAKAEHIFWHCKLYVELRDPYLLQLNHIRQQYASHDNAAYQKLCEYMQLPCFRNCGIMVGGDKIRTAHINLPAIDEYDDASKMTEVCDRHNDYNSLNDEKITTYGWECTDDIWRIVAYTDGSAFDPTCKYMARAGWGVYYAADHPHSAHDHLYGPIQTSYRAEVRAILHVVRTSANPTNIKCECLSVVTIFNKILKGVEVNTGELSDGDLWSSIKILVNGAAPDHYRCDWVPSHLNDEGNEAKREQMINDGVVTPKQIIGNDGADHLAKLGAPLHCLGEHVLKAQTFRKQATMVA